MNGKLLIAALALFALAGERKRAAPPPPRALPPSPPNAKGGGDLDPYVPTPPAVVARALALLPVLPLGAERVESDPTGKYSRVVYRAEWHGASPAIPKTHKGISVYRPHARTE